MSIYHIVKTVHGFKYYALFPDYPENFRKMTWEGLVDNATSFSTSAKAWDAMPEAHRGVADNIEPELYKPKPKDEFYG